jgi:hypothetical protein
MKARTAVATALLLGIAAPAAMAQDAAAPKVVKVAIAKPSAKQAAMTDHALPAKGTVEQVSAQQLSIASHVLTGKAECEFNQTVSVESLPSQPGHFKVGYKNASYTMIPEETSTGAVRLQDKNAGVMWLQIANKSMLMNSKIGQRMVDSCMHAEQRATVAAAKSGKSLLQ